MNLHINKPYGTLAHVSNSKTPVFFEAVFFDMDGLFVDSEPLWLESERDVTAPYQYQWTDDDQVACLGGPLSRVGEYMYERCGAETPEFFTQTLIEVQTNKLRGKTPLMPGAIELVRELQAMGVPTALVSASPRVIVDAVLENLGGNPFPFSISSDDVVNTKPHPDAYLLAANKCNADISQSLIFEDSLTGVSAAKASGAWLIAVPHLVTIPESARVRSIKSLEQITFVKLEGLYADFTSTI
ncbi:MAG: HAD family phosphatase [Streptomycetaceae bacterium]|nr:MAG: HAD family phosphatase [Streptomycetaceae bacterium]